MRCSVAVGDGQGVDRLPVAGIEGQAEFGQLESHRLQHAEARHVILLQRGAGLFGDARRAEVGGELDDLGDREPAMLGMEVVDRETADADGVDGVERVGEGDRAGIERHGRVEQLEGGAHLVDAEGIPVEARLVRRVTR
jgi:hypothetical protein